MTAPPETWAEHFARLDLTITDAAARADVSRSVLSKAVRGTEARQAGWWHGVGRNLGVERARVEAMCEPAPSGWGYTMWKART
jgi:hypothetical protein